MWKTVVILLATFMVTAAGCQKKEEPAKMAAPQVAAQAAPTAAVPQAAPQAAQPAAPPTAAATAPAGNDPHAGLKLKEIPAGTGHKGKVVQVMDAGGYTYLEVVGHHIPGKYLLQCRSIRIPLRAWYLNHFFMLLKWSMRLSINPSSPKMA